jgi:hypothetical protein
MTSQLTWIGDGGAVRVEPHHVVVADIVGGKLFVLCTTGLRSQMNLKYRDFTAWLHAHNIECHQIDKFKIGCRPHVLGYRSNYSLIYDPVFFSHIPESCKPLFDDYSIKPSFKQQWH